jgi:DNA-binding transcriptional ArsR family regulator
VLRFEAIAHNTAELRCGRMIEKFPQIVTRLAGIVERFATALDSVHTGFLGDGVLDELPTGVRLGATRVGGVDLNKPHIREALRAALTLAPTPNGFTVAEFTAKVHALTGVDHTGYTARQAAYHLRKLRGKRLVDKPSRARRYHVGAPAARTIAALLTLRDQVIAPIFAGVRSPKMGRKPTHWTRVDRDYERIRIDMQTLFNDLAIETPLAA